MTTITVFQTDADGAFLHPVIATELALSPGTYNVPFGATLTAPPDTPEGFVAVAAGEDWITLEDHRKDTLYLAESGASYALKTTLAMGGAPVRYSGLGPVPDWLTDTKPILSEDVTEKAEEANGPDEANDPA